MNNPFATSVLMREVSRTARRWQTYGMRSAFSAALLGFMLVAIWLVVQSGQIDTGESGTLGRNLFIGISAFQVLLAVIVAPLLVARGIIEERLDDTVELLVLTRLTAAQVVGSKVMSRVLLVLMVILGALPVLALVTQLGGVSVIEVAAVSLHTVTAVLLLGCMGAFFAVFTRSPLLATFAAVLYVLPAFLLLPLVYTTFAADWHAMAHVSPLFGSLSTDWRALLPLPTLLPIIVLVFSVGSDAFQLRVGGAKLRRFFEPTLWRTPRFWKVVIAFCVWSVVVLPIAASLRWALLFNTAMLNNTVGWMLTGVHLAAGFGLWVWYVLLLWIVTWVYLRLAMDVVLAIDHSLSPSGGERVNRLPIRGNPVRWREMSWQSWRRVGPAFTGWGMMLLFATQSGVWVIPGGLAGIGAVNAVVAIFLAIWLGTSVIATERDERTLEHLLATTLPTWRIVVGKVLAAGVPAFLLQLLSVPLIVFGLAYWGVFTDKPGNMLWWSLSISLWLFPFQFMMQALAMLVALRVKAPRSAFGINLAIGASLVVVPTVAVVVLRGFRWLVFPLRVWMPILWPEAAWWEILASATGMSMLAVLLFGVLLVRFRSWGLAHG